MNGKKSLTRSRKFRERVTAVVASAGAIAMTAGFMMMAAAGPANADNDNQWGNSWKSFSTTSEGPGNSENAPGQSGDVHGQGGDNGKKVNVCHATNSMTNPYVFINVSTSAVTHGKGHYMHMVAPNKIWKEAADWNEFSYGDGDSRPDFIEGYDLDGSTADFTFDEEWCEAAPTPPGGDRETTAVKPSVDQAGPCEVEGSFTIPNTTGVDYSLDGKEIDPGTYDGPDSGTITAEAENGYELTDDGFSYGLYVAAAEACPVVAPAVDVCPNLTGNQAEVPGDRVKNGAGNCVIPAEVAGTETASPKPVAKPDKTPQVKGTEAVPTAVAAGIGDGPTMTGALPIDLLAQMLVGGGLALLMAAGWLQIGRQTRGVHQA